MGRSYKKGIYVDIWICGYVNVCLCVCMCVCACVHK